MKIYDRKNDVDPKKGRKGFDILEDELLSEQNKKDLKDGGGAEVFIIDKKL